MLEALQDQEQAAGETQEDVETALLVQVGPLLQAIAAAAGGEEAHRQEIEQALMELETHGWHLQGAGARLWAGSAMLGC